ncbi:MAG: hypothetical protein EOO17_04545 [Chloroflexi bacterium]|nr:MAG: hypothetical protein EOO17_04545 [Chloroflexota bacterium]
MDSNLVRKLTIATTTLLLIVFNLFFLLYVFLTAIGFIEMAGDPLFVTIFKICLLIGVDTVYIKAVRHYRKLYTLWLIPIGAHILLYTWLSIPW